MLYSVRLDETEVVEDIELDLELRAGSILSLTLD